MCNKYNYYHYEALPLRIDYTQNHTLIYDIQKFVYWSVRKKNHERKTETLQRNNAGGRR